jgi:hypothetical protein
MPSPMTTTVGAFSGAATRSADGALTTCGRMPAIRPASLDTESMVTSATQLA